MSVYKSLSLRENFVWAFVGNVVYHGCQWGSLVVLAKLGRPEIVGIFIYALAIATPITILGNLQLNAVLVTDARNEYFFHNYLALRIITAVVSVCVIALVALGTGEDIETVSVIMVIGLSQGLLSVREIFLSAMQKKERMDMVSVSNIILGCLSLVVFGSILYLTGKLVFAIIGTASTRLLVLVIRDYGCARRLVPREEVGFRRLLESLRSCKLILKLALLSLPLGITMGIISFNANMPRYFLEHFHDKATLGYYGAMASLLAAGRMIIAALGQSTSPRLAKYFAYNKSAFKRLLVKLVCIGFGLGALGLLVAVFFGRYILTVFFTSEYAVYYREFNWIMLAGAITFGSAFLGYGITAARYFKINIPVFGFVGITTAVCSWALIPWYGIIGAAWSVAIASAIALILSFLVINYALWKG